MAENTVMGLFGASPYDVASNYINQDAAQAVQFANLTPQQQGQYGMFAGGAGLGRVLGNVMGGGDPAMQQAQQMQQVKRWVAENGIDLNTPEGLRQTAVYSNQIGAPEGAAFFGRQAMAIEAQQAETGLKKAQAIKALKEPQGTETERARNFLIQVEQRLANGEEVPPEAKNQAALILQELSKPKSFFDAVSGQMITQPGINPLQALPNLSASITGARPATAGGQAAPQGGEVTAGGQVQAMPGGITTTQVTQPKMDASTVAKIAEIDAKLPLIDKTISNIDTAIPTLKNLDLGLLQNTGRGIMAFTGNNTKDRIGFDNAYRIVREAANNLLVQAKGTQTEGDAQRAYDAIMNPDTWKNNEALSAAFDNLKATTKATKEGLMASRSTFQSGGKTQAPQKQTQTKTREERLQELKQLNPGKSEAVLNKKLDELGVK